MFKAKVIKSYKVETKKNSEGRDFTKSDFLGEVIEATPRSYIGKQMSVKTYHDQQFVVGSIVEFEGATLKDYENKEGKIVEFFQVKGKPTGASNSGPTTPPETPAREERAELANSTAPVGNVTVNLEKLLQLEKQVKTLEEKLEKVLTALENVGKIKG